MVAHATVLLVATAPAVAPPGGRQRAPPEDDGLQPAMTISSYRLRSPRAGRLVHQDVSSMRANRGGTPRAQGCSPRCSPFASLPTNAKYGAASLVGAGRPATSKRSGHGFGGPIIDPEHSRELGRND